MNTNIRVKTAQAAEVAGVGYEGFRSWLKRGLLKNTGTLPQFYAADTDAEIADAKRWRWSAFGFADLCCFRLTKILLDLGLSWEIVDAVASDQTFWQSHRSDHPNTRYVAIFPASRQWTLYSAEELADDIRNHTIQTEAMTLVDLQNMRQDVIFRTRAATLRAIADDMKRTSHIFARTGSITLPPEEAKGIQERIEALADGIGQLAAQAEQGAGTYQEFEILLRRLHKENKFPENAAVSAVATAFVDERTL